MDRELLRIADLSVSFPLSKGGTLDAVKGSDLVVCEKERHALIGASGSGKTVSILAAIGLLPSNALVTGSIKYQGQELRGQSETEWQKIRGSQIAMVFQDALGSLNPALKIKTAFLRVLAQHRKLDERQGIEEAKRLMASVQLDEAKLEAYPHELSGGQAQRITIALALACQPKLLILDEPTSALDAPTTKGLLKLLKDLNTDLGLAMLVVSHDLFQMSEWATTLSLIENGKVTKSGPAPTLFQNPQNDYLIAAIGASGSSQWHSYVDKGSTPEIEP